MRVRANVTCLSQWLTSTAEELTPPVTHRSMASLQWQNWLGDIRDSMKLKNLPVYYGAAGVGDVVAWRSTDAANTSGHSGISIGGGVMIYAGGQGGGTPQYKTIAYMNERMQTESRYLGLVGPSHEPGVIRRYNGKP